MFKRQSTIVIYTSQQGRSIIGITRNKQDIIIPNKTVNLNVNINIMFNKTFSKKIMI